MEPKLFKNNVCGLNNWNTIVQSCTMHMNTQYFLRSSINVLHSAYHGAQHEVERHFWEINIHDMNRDCP